MLRFLLLTSPFLFDQDPGPTPGLPPAPAPAPPNPAPAPPAPAPADPNAEPSWLPGRLTRERNALLKKYGVETEEQLQAKLDKAKKLEEDDEKRRQEQLTETQREKERADKAEGELKESRTKADASERRAKLLEAAGARGIKNTSYADYLLAAHNKDADFGALLDGLLKDDANRTALQATPVPVVPVPPGNTNPGAGGAPPPAPPAPGNQPPVDVMKMTDVEWREHKRKLEHR